MEGTYRGLSVRTFGAGLVLLLVGGGLFALNIYPRPAGRIHLSALVAGPLLAIGGIWASASSIRAHFCARCRHEFASASGTYALGSEPAIRALLEKGCKPAPEEIQLARKDESSVRVDLEYCPVCVAIGEARLRTSAGEKMTYLLNGGTVRMARENLFL